MSIVGVAKIFSCFALLMQEAGTLAHTHGGAVDVRSAEWLGVPKRDPRAAASR